MPNKMLFVAYEPIGGDVEYFDTYEKAEKWLLAQDFSDGYDDEYVDGSAFIAQILSHSKFIENDNKNKYPRVVNGETEDWPYGADIDVIGDLVMEKEGTDGDDC